MRSTISEKKHFPPEEWTRRKILENAGPSVGGTDRERASRSEGRGEDGQKLRKHDYFIERSGSPAKDRMIAAAQGGTAEKLSNEKSAYSRH